MEDCCWFVVKITGYQASAIIAGPLSGAEAYAEFAANFNDGGTAIIVPANIVADIMQGCTVATAEGNCQ